MALSPLMLGGGLAAAAAAAAYLLLRKKSAAPPPPPRSVESMSAPAPRSNIPILIPKFYPQAKVLSHTTASSPWLKASMMSWASDNAPAEQLTASVGPTGPSGPSDDLGFSLSADGSASLDSGLDGQAQFSFSGDPVVARRLHRRRLLRASGL